MRTIYLMRHAKSDWSTPSKGDHDRPLNARGREACERMRLHFLAEHINPDVILCSDSERTRETLRRIESTFSPAPTVVIDEDLYLASAQTISNKISQLSSSYRSVLVIAHYPGVQETALALAVSAQREDIDALREKFPTGAVATIEAPAVSWKKMIADGGALTQFLRPKQLPPVENI